jgi:hypothetical protein
MSNMSIKRIAYVQLSQALISLRDGCSEMTVRKAGVDSTNLHPANVTQSLPHHSPCASQVHSSGLHLTAKVATEFDESFYTPQQRPALSEYAIKCLEKLV